MLWCNYKPKTLDDFLINQELINKLKKYTNSIKKNENMLNLVFCGVSNSCKLTICRCFLASIYGKKIYNLQTEEYVTKQNCTHYTVKILYSKYHYEISFCGLQYADKSVLIEILDKYFSTYNVDNQKYKILVIRDFDVLSKPAQFALRRKIELNSYFVRFIFIIKSRTKIEESLLSRLQVIRCRKPNTTEIEHYVNYVLEKEKIKIPSKEINTIINKSQNNIGNSLYYIEMYRSLSITNIKLPEKNIIDSLIDLLDSSQFNPKIFRKIIDNILLSRLNKEEVFKKILLKGVELIKQKYKDSKNSLILEKISNLYEEGSKLQSISSSSNKFTISIENLIIYIFIYCKTKNSLNILDNF